MKKIYVMFVALLVMAMTVEPLLGQHTHDGITFTEWTSTNSLPTTAGNYYLSQDVTISSTWSIPSGTTNLCLNGHGIRRTGNGRVIEVGSNKTLNLYDCDNTTEHSFMLSNDYNGAGLATVDATLTSGHQTFTGGYITGGSGAYYSYCNMGGAFIVYGTMNIYGGTIIGNQTDCHGGSIFVTENGTLTLYGGSIKYNYCNYQGAGILSEGTLRIYGGEISHNRSGGDDFIHAGGISMTRGSFYIHGAPIISDNIGGNGRASSVYNQPSDICLEQLLTIDGEMTNTTPIGIMLNIDNYNGTQHTIFTTAGSVVDNNTASHFVGLLYPNDTIVSVGGDLWMWNPVKDEISHNLYDVTFNSMGGSEVPAQTVFEGYKLTSPSNPIKDGYLFTGWYKDENLTQNWDFSTDVVTKDTTLYAAWGSYVAVTFNTNDSSKGLVYADYFNEGFENNTIPSNLVISGNGQWEVVSKSGCTGMYCIRNKNTSNNGTSIIELTYPFVADGTISFRNLISSESGYDYGHFYIDGVEQFSRSGSGGWESRSYNISEGTHTFKWTYSKDYSGIQGDDAFYIDDILIKIESPIAYVSGQTVHAVAVPNPGNFFVNWTNDNDTIETNPELSFIADRDTVITANFESYIVLTLNSNDAVMGSAVATAPDGLVEDQDGKYLVVSDTTVTLTAIPSSDGYEFTGWSDNNTDNPRQVTITQDTTFTANFVPKQYTITVVSADENMGTVNGSGTYDFNTQAALTATPFDGYSFSGWQDQNMDNPRQITVTQDSIFTANFVTVHTLSNIPMEWAVKVNGNEQVITAGAVSNIPFGATVTLTPLSNRPVDTIEGVTNTYAGGVYSFVMPNEDVSLNIIYEEIPVYTITAASNDESMGTVALTRNVSCSFTPAKPIFYDSNFGYVSAAFNSGSWTTNTTISSSRKFIINLPTGMTVQSGDQIYLNGSYGSGSYGWIEVDGSGNGSRNWHYFSSYNAQNIGGNLPSYCVGNTSVSFNAQNNCSHNIYSSTLKLKSMEMTPTIDRGQTYTLVATPLDGYRFVNWTVGDEVISTEATYEAVAEESRHIVGNFGIGTYNIAAVVTGVGTVQIDYTDLYNVAQSIENASPTAEALNGTEVTLTAIPGTHYNFTHWTNNLDDQEITTNTITVTPTSSVTYTAHFIPDTFTVTLSMNDGTLGSVAFNEPYSGTTARVPYGYTASFTATPEEGLSFVRWTNTHGDTIGISTDATKQITVTQDSVIVADFGYKIGVNKIRSGSVKMDYTDIDGVSQSMDNITSYTQVFTHSGDAVTLTATSTEHYHFRHWTNSLNADKETSNPITFTPSATIDYTAEFAIDTHTVTVAANNPAKGSIIVKNILMAEGFEEGVIPDMLTISGAGSWSVVSPNNGQTGTFCIKSVNTGLSSRSIISMTVTFTGNGTISFRSRTSSETNNDFGYFHIDDQEKFKRSGNGSWITDTYEITPGTHTFRWSYSKDYSVSSYSDCLFIDDIIIKEDLVTSSAETYQYTYGQTCEVVAVPEVNHFFVNWTDENDNVMGTDDTMAFIVTGDTNVTANFIAPSSTLTVNSDDENMGTVSGGGSYENGDQAILTATPNYGYQFAGWDDNGDEILDNTENPRTVTVATDSTITAYFILVTLGVTPEGELTAQSDRFVDEHGEIVGSPRLTEHGEIIGQGNEGSSSGDTPAQLQTITISKGLGPQNVSLQYATGDTWEQALARPENDGCGATVSNNLVIYGTDTTIYMIDDASSLAPQATDPINPNSTYSWNQ